jgi:DNA-binding XRE family transcriptional regulator
MLNGTYTCVVSLMSEVAAVINPGHLIREQRHALGWSQQELAELCGVTQADLSRIENGRLDARWSTIQRIMAVLSDPSNRPRRSLANGGRRTPPPEKPGGPIWRPSGPVLSVGSIDR